MLKFKLSNKDDDTNCDSSAESECSILPASPNNKAASDYDWPSINSDGSSDEEEDGDDNDDDEPSMSKFDDEDFLSLCTEDIHLLTNDVEVSHLGCQRSGKASNSKGKSKHSKNDTYVFFV